MNRFSFENQGTNTYLVYTIDPEDELDSMSLGMLTNNKIPGIADASFYQVDSTKYIKYNVSAKVSVSQQFSGPVNKKRLIGVFTGIIDAMLSAEEYMLNMDSMLLDLDYIFADVTTCEAVLICLPVMNLEHKNPELGVFFKNIMFNTQFDQTENCDHVAKIINYLNTNSVLSLTDFKFLLDGISKPKEVKKELPEKRKKEGLDAEKPKQQPVVTSVQPQVLSAQPNVPLQSVPREQYTVSSTAPVRLDETMRPQNLEPEEKPISLFYLLQHYNKENAAKYKAQKAAKNGKKQDSSKSVSPEKTKKNPSSGQGNAEFAVPGKQGGQINPGFAVPGQNYAAMETKPSETAAGGNSQPIARQSQPTVPQQQPAVQQPARSINFGETTVLGSPMGETTVLGAAPASMMVKPYLLREKNNEKIPINKPVFRIGKEKSYVDYFIGDNTAISRSHANIVNRDGEFFAVDTNSTNHTYVNGTMIQSNVETKLSNGAKLRLANEEFEFLLQ
ncbi:MAG: DUF6382 domain-containing protein [Faecousia sp.]